MTKLFKPFLVFLGLTLLLIACEPINFTDENSISGTWTCVEQHEEDGASNYKMEIKYNQSDSSIIYIHNFLNLNISTTNTKYVQANVSGSVITIPEQIIEQHTVKGSGYINSDKTIIDLDFTDNLYGTPWTVTATLEKY